MNAVAWFFVGMSVGMTLAACVMVGSMAAQWVMQKRGPCQCGDCADVRGDS